MQLLLRHALVMRFFEYLIYFFLVLDMIGGCLKYQCLPQISTLRSPDFHSCPVQKDAKGTCFAESIDPHPPPQYRWFTFQESEFLWQTGTWTRSPPKSVQLG